MTPLVKRTRVDLLGELAILERSIPETEQMISEYRALPSRQLAVLGATTGG